MTLGGRRDRKRKETRESMRNAALRLALEHGYDQLTVEAITEVADVSVRTFFNYFASKDDALFGPDPDRAADLEAALVGRPAGEPPMVALRAVLEDFAEEIVAGQSTSRLRMDLLRAQPQLWGKAFAGLAAFERSLTEAVAVRTGRDSDVDLYPGVVTAAVMGAMRVAVAHWRAGGAEGSLPGLLTAAFDILAVGLSGPQAPSLDAPVAGARR